MKENALTRLNRATRQQRRYRKDRLTKERIDRFFKTGYLDEAYDLILPIFESKTKPSKDPVLLPPTYPTKQEVFHEVIDETLSHDYQLKGFAIVCFCLREPGDPDIWSKYKEN